MSRKDAHTTFNAISKELHQRKRKLLARAFSSSSLPGYEPALVLQFGNLVRKLRGKATDAEPVIGKVFNVAHEFHCLMLDVMGNLCFGAAFGFLENESNGVITSIQQRAKRILMVRQIRNTQGLRVS